VTITLNSWSIPAFLTVIIWLCLMVREPERGSGWWDFDVKGMFLGVLAVFATLLLWLIYFALRFAFG
jgi:hypothetical protein